MFLATAAIRIIERKRKKVKSLFIILCQHSLDFVRFQWFNYYRSSYPIDHPNGETALNLLRTASFREWLLICFSIAKYVPECDPYDETQ